jgi:hypothetical protein
MIDLLNPDKGALGAELKAKWEHLLPEVTHLNKWDRDEELFWWAEWASTRSEILELGAYNGASTKIMLLANPDLKIYVIDLWEDPGTQETFDKAMEEFMGGRIEDITEGRQSRIKIWWGTTESGLKHLLDEGVNAFDGLMVDAGHTKELVLTDIRLGLQLMQPGTLICGHDYHPSWPDNGVSQAVIELLPGHVNPIASIWAFQMP